LVTLEDNVVAGGAGAAVLECLQREAVLVPVLNLGLPDTFVDHGKREEQLAWVGLDADGVLASIQKRLTSMNEGKAPLGVANLEL
ncbi:MAG: 1-deoxy-D-xylulose-5-phosphate synthase, partial [Gammaproteobacteria bacterium]|nr:1-deoxy-D-xylulose-5-phosphate synthase [Gammaproteobacteria bacterium]